MIAISAILFDLNGMLYGYDRDARIACLATVTGRSPDAVKAAIWDSGFEDSGGAVRVGIVHYNTADEVDRLLGVLAAL